MMVGKNIGFIVWGILPKSSAGFSSNILSSSGTPPDITSYFKDIRSLMHGKKDNFYAVEKFDGFTLLSILKPKIEDSFSRVDLFLAISLYIPQGYHFKGDSLNKLEHLMSYIIEKQGNKGSLVVSEKMIADQLQDLDIEKNTISYTDRAEHFGHFVYREITDIHSYFKEPDIFGFKKVYFDKDPDSAIAKLPGIQPISSFERPVRVVIQGFDAGKYSILLNNREVHPQGSPNTEIFAKRGDQISFREISTRKISASHSISIDNRTFNLSQIFPPKGVQGGGNGGKKKPRLDWELIISLFLILSILTGLSIYLYKEMFPPKPLIEQQTKPIPGSAQPQNGQNDAIIERKNESQPTEEVLNSSSPKTTPNPSATQPVRSVGEIKKEDAGKNNNAVSNTSNETEDECNKIDREIQRKEQDLKHSGFLQGEEKKQRLQQEIDKLKDDKVSLGCQI
jgi:hypothetical protein